MTVKYQGQARVVGHNINTDYIISSTRKMDSIDPDYLKDYLFEVLDPDFASSLRPGDLIVAGENFGCGSAMEVAVTALRAAGIPAILAMSFARTYYRNAINNGLVPVECDTSGIQDRDELTVVVDTSRGEVRNITRDQVIRCPGLPPLIMGILESGGLVQHLRQHGRMGGTDAAGIR